MTNRVDWWNRYQTSDDPDLVVTEMAQEIERLRDVLKRIAASHGASDHACFRRSLADIAIGDAPVHEPSVQAPIAKITIRESGAGHYAPDDVSVSLYAPGLPAGEHDVYCAPESVAPMLTHTWQQRGESRAEFERDRGFVPRCRCGGQLRATLLGRMVCSSCGQDHT